MLRSRFTAWISMLIVGAAVLGVVLGAASGATQRYADRNDNTFRISVPAGDFDYTDPALAYTAASGALLSTTCANLYNHPDKPPPQGLVAVPEVAKGYPRVSHGGRTLTFTLRTTFHFSDKTAVGPRAFATAINRMLSPAMGSPWVDYVKEIVGAEEVLAGKAPAASGVIAHGNTLTIRLTRPVPDFAARLTMPVFCAVPPAMRIDAEGVREYPGAGPYYVAEYVRGSRIVLKRNRFYHGTRTRHVDSFVVHLVGSTSNALDDTERGRSDLSLGAAPANYLDPARDLVRKYDVNKAQFWVKPGLAVLFFALNTSRPPFQNNPSLRRAINFAVDRSALRRVAGGPLVGTLADQYLPAGFPHVRQGQVYPLGRPNVRRAQALAQGHLGDRRAVLYVPETFDHLPISMAQILKQNLERIGLKIQIDTFPIKEYFRRIRARDEPFDIAWSAWDPDYVDPSAYINPLLDGRLITKDDNANLSHFNSARWNRRMDAAAALHGAARYRAYGRLDRRIVRDAAPMVAFRFASEMTLVSKRVGCIVLRPKLDLTSVCLK